MMKPRTISAVLLLALAACSQGEGSARESVAVGPTPTEARSPNPQRTPTATRQEVAGTPENDGGTPTPTPCAGKGRIEENEVPDEGFGRELPYLIYLPPCMPSEGEPLPVLYLLHGLARDNEQWLEIGVQETADELIRRGTIPPLAIVLPWERTGVQLEPALIDGLLAHVNAHYPVDNRRESRAIGGVSRGGGWAFHIAMRHPEQFSAVGLHSPAILAGDLFAVERWLEQHPAHSPPRIWVDIGDKDSLQSSTNDLLERLDELGLPYTYRPGKGRHELSYWQSKVRQYLRWYAQEW